MWYTACLAWGFKWRMKLVTLLVAKQTCLLLFPVSVQWELVMSNLRFSSWRDRCIRGLSHMLTCIIHSWWLFQVGFKCLKYWWQVSFRLIISFRCLLLYKATLFYSLYKGIEVRCSFKVLTERQGSSEVQKCKICASLRVHLKLTAKVFSMC